MRLKRLEVFGFKSFGKKVVIDFPSAITAVVGPNGSGKSNVAESLRFVLGEQSMKSMRGKRGEDLIWNGSTGVPRAARASATLVFDNTDRAFGVDWDEVAISREVYRDGTNEYFLNGTKVRLKDITDLLAQVQIGASGYHMISQGEADRVLSASPKERREMLEDALGLKAYIIRREETERRLTKTEENMRQAEALRRELAPHLKFLKRQVEKVREAEGLRARLLALYREYLKREEIYVERMKWELAHKRSDPAARLSQLSLEVERLRGTLAAETSDHAEADQLLALEASSRAAREQEEATLRALGRIDGMIEAANRALKRKEEALRRTADIPVRLGDVEDVVLEVEAAARETSEWWDIKAVQEKFRTVAGAARSFIEERKVRAGAVEGEEEKAELARLEIERARLLEDQRGARASSERISQDIASLRQAGESARERSREAERLLYEIMERRRGVEAELDHIRMQEEVLERDARRLADEENEAGVLLGRAVLDLSLVALSEEEVLGEPREAQETRRREIERGKIKLEDAGAQGGEDVLKEFEETDERDRFLAGELVDLATTATSLRSLVAELDQKLANDFREGLAKINTEFGTFFRAMFGGGAASLSLSKIVRRRNDEDTDLDVDDDAVDEAGVEVSVALPNKKVRGLQMLSGGERALTSTALLFAMSRVNPPPFMVLDETDAALDEANSRKYGDLLVALARGSQLIVITHNRETMSRAGVLYGVTMGIDAVSKLLSISFDDANAFAK